MTKISCHYPIENGYNNPWYHSKAVFIPSAVCVNKQANTSC